VTLKAEIAGVRDTISNTKGRIQAAKDELEKNLAAAREATGKPCKTPEAATKALEDMAAKLRAEADAKVEKATAALERIKEKL
jgi:hypothetical protein